MSQEILKNGKSRVLSCSDCGTHSCDSTARAYPKFCPTVKLSKEETEAIKNCYRDDPEIYKIFYSAAKIEGEHYGKMTRVEETVYFIKEMGYKRIGIATCMALINETKLFTKVLDAKGINNYVVAVCKVGSIDKTEIGLPDGIKIHPGNFEPSCNPIMQAKILEEAGTDFNIVIGLCVGHDTVFLQRSKAPCTVLVVKDRVLVHNPCAALYNSHAYYKRVVQKED